jgi:Integrase zinc binding domain/Integrase core domain
LVRLLDPREKEENYSFDMEGEKCLQIQVQSSTPVALRLEDIEEENERDVEFQELSRSLESGVWEDSTKAYHAFTSEISRVGNFILRGTRLIIPTALRQQTLKLAHEGHLGMSSMKQRLRSKVWWPKMDRDCEDHVKSCHGCQLVASPDPPEPLRRTTLPSKPWEYVSVDFLGPLPSGHSLMITVDYYSRFYEVDIMKSTTAQLTIQRLKPIFVRFGLPYTIRTDNGPQFISEDFQEFCAENNIEICYTTPLWPQANGEVERQNRSLLKRLKIAQATGKDWRQELLIYLSVYRNTPHATTGVSPAELMFNRKIRDKLPTFEVSKAGDEEVRDRDTERKWKGKVLSDKLRKVKQSPIAVGDVVLLRQQQTNKLTPLYNPIPNQVIHRKGNNVTVRTPAGVQYTRNSTFLKRYNASNSSNPVRDAGGTESPTQKDEPISRDAPASPVALPQTQGGPKSPLPQCQDAIPQNVSDLSGQSERCSDRPQRQRRIPARYQD